jgi:CheY-like chemotaxis protein
MVMTPRPMEHCSVLVVEADPLVRHNLVEALTAWGVEVRQAQDLATAVPASLTWGPFHAIICGQSLPDGSGTCFLRWLREQVITVPFILLAGSVAPDLRSSSRVGLVASPVDVAELRTTLARLLAGVMVGVDGAGKVEFFTEDGTPFPVRERDGDGPSGRDGTAGDLGMLRVPITRHSHGAHGKS